MRKWQLIAIIGTILATLACGGAQGPELAPKHAQAQQTVDKIAQSRSVVRWLDAIYILLDEFDQIEHGLYQQNIIDGPTHGRIDVLMDFTIAGAVDILKEIERASEDAKRTGVYTLNAAPMASILLMRLQSVDLAVLGVNDPKLMNTLALTIATAQMVLQVLDPDGLVTVAQRPQYVAPPVTTAPPTPRIPLVSPPPVRNIH